MNLKKRVDKSNRETNLISEILVIISLYSMETLLTASWKGSLTRNNNPNVFR